MGYLLEGFNKNLKYIIFPVSIFSAIIGALVIPPMRILVIGLGYFGSKYLYNQDN